jgi:hypothetical protein
MFTFIVIFSTFYLHLPKNEVSWKRFRKGLLNRYSISVNGGFVLCAGGFHLSDWKFVNDLPLWIRPLANKSLHFVCCAMACFAICGTFAWMKEKFKEARVLGWLKGWFGVRRGQ